MMRKVDQVKTGFTRRSFNTGLLGLGAAAIVGVHPAQANTPNKGGQFRLGIASGHTSDTLDPGQALNENLQVAGFALRNCLVEVGPDAELLPELAVGWEPSADAKTWAFELRKGVEFHNGKSFTSEDAIDSINWHRRDDATSQAKNLLAQIQSIKADGNKIVFELESGNADFPAVLAHYNLQIFPAGTERFDEGLGTGGYMLENFEPGVSIKVKRNPNYWKADRANFEDVEIFTVVDKNARQVGLASGSLDYIDRLDARVVKFLKQNEDIRVIAAKGGLHYALPMRTDIEPFDNNDVRLALKHAIDRASINSVILAGLGEIGNDQPISGAYRFFNDELPQRSYDPDKSKFHLQRAGMEKLTVDLSVAEVGFQGAKDVGALYREHAIPAGIDINVVAESEDGYWDSVWMKKGWCAVQWYGSPTEDIRLTSVYSADSPWNDTFWKHPRFNDLLVQARSELDEQKRRTMYAEIQTILCNEGGVVIPVFAPFLEGAAAKLASGKISPQGPLDGTRIIERWWWS